MRISDARDDELRVVLLRQTVSLMLKKGTVEPAMKEGTKLAKENIDEIEFRKVDLQTLKVQNKDASERIRRVVEEAQRRGIRCLGRGSAANSIVTYLLDITRVCPIEHNLLFERFLHRGRKGTPDIDLDFDSSRRGEIIEWMEERFGADHTGMSATIDRYLTKSAVQDTAKALGWPAEMAVQMSKRCSHALPTETENAEHIESVAGGPSPLLRILLGASTALLNCPRHLGQHSGGMVLTRAPMRTFSPLQESANGVRIVQFDKYDLEYLGLVKLDVLGLRMLGAVSEAVDIVADRQGDVIDLDGMSFDDERVYDMICEGDVLGLFQIEAPAQMSAGARIQARSMQDLIKQISLVRPGPIQGDMVHPYLRRRNGEEQAVYPSAELEQVLGKTLGVPLFQEQAMKIAIVAAGFTPSEADRLRRAMATFRHAGTIHTFRTKLVDGMVANGSEADFAERCFKQIEGFGEYGFPESHAASFALLVYVSAWLKCHYPDVFAAAILNSQPMGFYAPAQIVRDARDHGVIARPPDVNHSDWDCALEPIENGEVALRLGLRQIKGFREAAAEQLVAARGEGYENPREMWRRAGLGADALDRLAQADAFTSMGLSRRAALWAVKGLGAAPLPLFAAAEARHGTDDADGAEPSVALPDMALGEEVVEDYRSLRLSPNQHPVALLRRDLARRNIAPSSLLAHIAPGNTVLVAGLAVCPQRPGTASGVGRAHPAD